MGRDEALIKRENARIDENCRLGREGVVDDLAAPRPPVDPPSVASQKMSSWMTTMQRWRQKWLHTSEGAVMRCI